jgi:hypothetical protein
MQQESLQDDDRWRSDARLLRQPRSRQKYSTRGEKKNVDSRYVTSFKRLLCRKMLQNLFIYIYIYMLCNFGFVT